MCQISFATGQTSSFGETAPLFDSEYIHIGCDQFVCSGDNAWCRFINDYTEAQDNHRSLALQSRGYGIKGMICINWGNMGNMNNPETSVPLFGYNASYSWNTGTSLAAGEIEAAVCNGEYGTPNLLPMLKELHKAEKFNWGDIDAWREEAIGHKVFADR